MSNYPSYIDCRKELLSLKEAIKYIKNNICKTNKIYNTFCNGNLIILGTFFESFNENIVQEYVDAVMVEFNNNKLNFSDLPSEMQKFISKNLLKKHHKPEFETMHYDQACKMTINIMNSLSENMFILNDELDNINKFSFGKHGETEIKKLFKRIGITIENEFDNFNELNNYFNLRNNLIHPASISLTNSSSNIEDVEKYLKYMCSYIRKINIVLNNNFSSLPIKP
jgi:hypothetical protein